MRRIHIFKDQQDLYFLDPPSLSKLLSCHTYQSPQSGFGDPDLIQDPSSVPITFTCLSAMRNAVLLRWYLFFFFPLNYLSLESYAVYGNLITLKAPIFYLSLHTLWNVTLQILLLKEQSLTPLFDFELIPQLDVNRVTQVQPRKLRAYLVFLALGQCYESRLASKRKGKRRFSFPKWNHLSSAHSLLTCKQVQPILTSLSCRGTAGHGHRSKHRPDPSEQTRSDEPHRLRS